jgi:hypothetical protein
LGDDRGTLLEMYETDKLAATSAAPRASQVATWCKFLELWHCEVMPAIPVEPEDIAHVGCVMNARGYRSFANFITAIKQVHVKAGHAWTAQHELEAKQGIRSVTRGQGPPWQAAPLVIEDVLALELQGGTDAVAASGPVNPHGSFFIGSAFMLREIELAYARLAHLRVDMVRKRASLELPVSKTDPSAVGCSRARGCTCQDESISNDCVFHAAAEHLLVVHAALGIAAGDPLSQALPLFPDKNGNTITKAAMVATVECLASQVGEPLLDSQGQRRFGGHSMRVSGAQWLGPLGFSVEQVKTFGRWASDTVVRYLGEAHVSDLARARRRFIREQGLLEGHLLATPAISGPSRHTAAEVERIAQESVGAQPSEVIARVEALLWPASPSYDLVLYERYKRVHKLAVDLAAPAASWQIQCGWKFATVTGWRLASSSQFRTNSGWKVCARCDIPPEVSSM